MKSKKYDVAVIGAGPAGSLCARNLARRGYEVLLAEKRPVVGVPVRCGEATGTRKRLEDFTPLNEEWIETDIHGVILHGPKQTTVRYDKPGIGLMLDRRLFDQDLAAQAAEAGADLQTDARICDVKAVANGLRELRIVKNGEEIAASAAMVVGADGAEALSGRWVGLKTRQLPPHTCSAIEFRLAAEDANPHHLTFWQGHETINRGYVWVFPKLRSKVVNLGAGIITPKMGERNVYDITMEFKEKLFPKAELLEVHGGAVPVSGTLEDYVDERFALCGDAAHHTNPMTGGGIVAGMAAAAFLSEWVDRGFQKGDLSKTFLKHYEKACWNRFGRNHRREMKIRDFVLGLPADGQVGFYDIFRDMVKKDFSRMSKARGYARLLGLAARNFDLTKKVFFS